MNYNEQAIKVLTEQMEKVAEQQISSAPFDQTYTFTVKQIKGNNEYVVTGCGMDLDIKTKNNLNFKIMDKVHITFVRGNINDKIILEDLQEKSETISSESFEEITSDQVDIWYGEELPSQGVTISKTSFIYANSIEMYNITKEVE